VVEPASSTNTMSPLPSPRTMPRVPSVPTPLSGRARSQKWREAQFERFQQLEDKR
jgi:hypothetical protein